MGLVPALLTVVLPTHCGKLQLTDGRSGSWVLPEATTHLPPVCGSWLSKSGERAYEGR